MYPLEMIIISVFLSNIRFWCIKETSQGGVSFTHQTHMYLIFIDKYSNGS